MFVLGKGFSLHAGHLETKAALFVPTDKAVGIQGKHESLGGLTAISGQSVGKTLSQDDVACNQSRSFQSGSRICFVADRIPIIQNHLKTSIYTSVLQKHSLLQ